MNARMKNLTDAQIKSWLQENIALRKQLKEHCCDYAYADEAESKILIYATKDFMRVAKILEREYTVVKDDSYDLKYTAKFEYLGIEIVTYAYSEGEFNE